MMWMIVALQISLSTTTTSTGFDLSKAGKSVDHFKLSVVSGCDDTASSPEEITVCGQHEGRYRLPLPVERSAARQARDDRATGVAALTPAAPCGMFAGQRTCSTKEAAAYGYGQGRDPLTVAVKLAGKLIDPDAD